MLQTWGEFGWNPMAKKQVAKAPPKATGQIACGYARCKTQMNCKNSNSLLAIKEVDHKRCRTLRLHVRFVKFCCPSHLEACKKNSLSQTGTSREGATDRRTIRNCSRLWFGMCSLGLPFCVFYNSSSGRGLTVQGTLPVIAFAT